MKDLDRRGSGNLQQLAFLFSFHYFSAGRIYSLICFQFVFFFFSSFAAPWWLWDGEMMNWQIGFGWVIDSGDLGTDW